MFDMKMDQYKLAKEKLYQDVYQLYLIHYDYLEWLTGTTMSE